MKKTGFSRVSKDLVIQQMETELKSAPVFFITEHGKVEALSMDKLRAKLRPSKSRYFSFKKSLGKKAFERAKITGFEEHFDGACGITFSGTDPVTPSKILVQFAKENEAFKIQAGYLNGQLISVDKIKALASLPSREVLLGKVLGGMQAPISNFVGVLAGTVRKVVTVLDAIAKKKSNG